MRTVSHNALHKVNGMQFTAAGHYHKIIAYERDEARGNVWMIETVVVVFVRLNLTTWRDWREHSKVSRIFFSGSVFLIVQNSHAPSSV